MLQLQPALLPDSDQGRLRPGHDGAGLYLYRPLALELLRGQRRATALTLFESVLGTEAGIQLELTKKPNPHALPEALGTAPPSTCPSLASVASDSTEPHTVDRITHPSNSTLFVAWKPAATPSPDW